MRNTGVTSDAISTRSSALGCWLLTCSLSKKRINESPIMKFPRVALWLAITALITVYGDVEYLHRRRNESVEFSCLSPKKDIAPFAFVLFRVWMQHKEVLYQNLAIDPVIHDEADKRRISVQKNQAIQKATVTITRLRGRDTDKYHCVFYYDASTYFYNHTAEMFFLYVEDPAAGLLFLCVLGFTVTFWKPASRAKAPAIPVYEEMNGVRGAKVRGVTYFPSLRLAEDDAVHRCRHGQAQKENPYVIPQEPPPAFDPLTS